MPRRHRDRLRGALPALAHLPWLGRRRDGLRAARDGAPAPRAIGVAAALGAIGLAGSSRSSSMASRRRDRAHAPVVAVVSDTKASGSAPVDGGGTPAGSAAEGGAVRSTSRGRGSTSRRDRAGLAISVVQWLPALLAIPHAVGGDVQALPLSRLVELVVPGSFGAGDPDRGVVAIGGAAAWLPSLFVGVPLLVLARPRASDRRRAARDRRARARRRPRRLAALARRTGAPRRGARRAARRAAAIGLDAIVAGERRAAIALAAGTAALVVGLVALAIRGRDGGVDRALVDGGLGAASVAGATALAYFTRARARGAIVIALLLAPSVGSLGSTAPVIDRDVVDTTPSWAMGPSGPWPRRVFRPQYMVKGYEPLDEALGTLAGDSAYYWGVGELRSESPARSPALDRMFAASARDAGSALTRYGASFPILPTSVTEGQHIHTLGPPRDQWILAHFPIVPPASLAYGWRWSRIEANALELLFPANQQNPLPIGTVVLDGVGESSLDKRPPVPCRVTRWEDGDIAVACSPRDPAYAVVSSAAADGWSVTVDGEDQPWLAADVLKRAVAVTPGAHDLQWTYRAPGFRFGVALALAGLVLIGGLAWRSRATSA